MRREDIISECGKEFQWIYWSNPITSYEFVIMDMGNTGRIIPNIERIENKEDE